MAGERRQSGIVWPVILILLGVALLLDRFDMVAIEWASLWRYWPILLILIGLDIMLARTRLGGLIVLVLTVAAIVAIVYLRPTAWLTETVYASQRFEYSAQGIDAATVCVEVGAGDLEVRALDDSELLYTADVDYDAGRVRVSGESEVERGKALVSLHSDVAGWSPIQGRAASVWQVSINPDVPLDLKVDGGVNRSTIDLTGLAIGHADVNTGVGTVQLILGERGPYRVDIGGGVGRLVVVVPEDLAARIRIDGGLGRISVDDRLEKQGAYYVTATYETADEAVLVDIDGGIGEIVIRYG